MERIKNLTEWSKEIHKANVEKGFYEEEKQFGTQIALIHSELSEALEADRHKIKADLYQFESLMEEGNEFVTTFKETVKDSVEDELADAMIRIMDTCGHLGIDIQKHIELKLRYNSTRAHKHGKNY